MCCPPCVERQDQVQCRVRQPTRVFPAVLRKHNIKHNPTVEPLSAFLRIENRGYRICAFHRSPREHQSLEFLSARRTANKQEPTYSLRLHPPCTLSLHTKSTTMATDGADQVFSTSQATHAPAADDSETLSPLEQEVLDEYARLLGNMNNVRTYPAHPRHPIVHADHCR